MRIRPIADWGDFTSTALIPTIMIGSGWVYLYWWQGRLGFRW